MQNMYRNH